MDSRDDDHYIIHRTLDNYEYMSICKQGVSRDDCIISIVDKYKNTM